jgi:hypothetical protein
MATARSITLINADIQADGSIKPNPSAMAGTCYALIALDDSVATAQYSKDKSQSNWDRAMIAQSIDTASIALGKLAPVPTAAQIAAQQAVQAQRAKLVAAITPMDQVP